MRRQVLATLSLVSLCLLAEHLQLPPDSKGKLRRHRRQSASMELTTLLSPTMPLVLGQLDDFLRALMHRQHSGLFVRGLWTS